MPSLKDLRGRINSVKSTQKITSAMKMVAASKLRRAQSQAEAARPYAERMQRVLAALMASVANMPGAPPMLVGTGREQIHLLIAITADRGLAGAFNSNVGRATRTLARKLASEGKTVKILTVGRKGRDFLRRELSDHLLEGVSYAGRKTLNYADAQDIGSRVAHMLARHEFDVCTMVYNRFVSVMSQVVTERRLIPAPLTESQHDNRDGVSAIYEFEPDEETLLARLLPENLAVQIFGAMLESAAGEHGARMSSMDSATRNAGQMIQRLTLNYNRTRQANITKELIEIISGAEAL
jgi:F-type H+-transporting ATPase subunit gamma